MHIHACLPWLLRPRMKSTLSIMSIRAPGRPDGAVATRRKYLILMFLLAMLGGADLHARELSVVASPWPPYVDQKTLRRGLAVQLVTEALERAGYSTRVILTRWRVSALQQCSDRMDAAAAGIVTAVSLAAGLAARLAVCRVIHVVHA